MKLKKDNHYNQKDNHWIFQLYKKNKSNNNFI